MKAHMRSTLHAEPICGEPVGVITDDPDQVTCGRCRRILERRNGSAPFRAPHGRARFIRHPWRTDELIPGVEVPALEIQTR